MDIWYSLLLVIIFIVGFIEAGRDIQYTPVMQPQKGWWIVSAKIHNQEPKDFYETYPRNP
jgi:hypothetical protein